MRIHYLVLMVGTCLTTSFVLHAQQKVNAPLQPGSDTARKPVPTLTQGPKPYREVITVGTKTTQGLFTVHFLKDRYYFEIPDSLLGRDILVVNRISKSAAGDRGSMLGYAGDEIGENVIHFEKGPFH